MGKIVSKRGKPVTTQPKWPFPTKEPIERLRARPDGTWEFSDTDAPENEEVLRRTTEGVDITHIQLEND